MLTRRVDVGGTRDEGADRGVEEERKQILKNWREEEGRRRVVTEERKNR